MNKRQRKKAKKKVLKDIFDLGWDKDRIIAIANDMAQYDGFEAMPPPINPRSRRKLFPLGGSR